MQQWVCVVHIGFLRGHSTDQVLRPVRGTKAVLWKECEETGVARIIVLVKILFLRYVNRGTQVCVCGPDKFLSFENDLVHKFERSMWSQIKRVLRNFGRTCAKTDLKMIELNFRMNLCNS